MFWPMPNLFHIQEQRQFSALFTLGRGIEMTELQNQLKNQTLDSLLPSSIKTVGGVVFPDQKADLNLEAFDSVVRHWQSVHVPSYGQPIAGSFASISVDGSETILTPGTNQVARVQMITCENLGGAPITLNIVLGTTNIVVGLVLGPASQSPLTDTAPAIFPLFLDKSQPLSVTVTGGNANDLVTEAIYSLISQ